MSSKIEKTMIGAVKITGPTKAVLPREDQDEGLMFRKQLHDAIENLRSDKSTTPKMLNVAVAMENMLNYLDREVRGAKLAASIPPVELMRF